MAAWVLAGEIGGTKTDLALYRLQGERRVALAREQAFPSQDYRGLEEVVREFLRNHRDGLEAAAFGIAGPVLGNEVTLTNLPWRVEARSLAEAIGCRGVRLMNDLETTAYGALFLEPVAGAPRALP